MEQYIQQETQKQQMQQPHNFCHEMDLRVTWRYMAPVTRLLLGMSEQEVIHELNEKCFDTCVEGYPGNKLDGRTQTCISNCVDRFLDTNLHLVQRFERTVNEKAAALGYTGTGGM